MKKNVEKFRFSELVDNLIMLEKPEIQAHHHRLEVDISAVEHENVCGDSLRIQQIFTNIMGNAVKFTPDGGLIRLTIREKRLQRPGTACFEFIIEDNGIGMSREFQRILFDPFTRADDERTSGIPGAGLGLAIAKSIVSMMDGEIEVESEEGKGSRFTVTIFLGLQDEKDETHEEPLASISASDYSGRRILLVEDNELNREIAKEILEMTNAKVESAENGKIAVDMLEEAPENYYDLVFMDIQMPVMNGYESARAIRALDKHYVKYIPIVALTANVFAEDVIMSRNAGMDEYLPKPIDVDRLAEVMHRYFGEVKQPKGI